MHEWDTFAVVVGGSAGALVGLLFVAISIHAQRIAGSADLRGRSAQTFGDLHVAVVDSAADGDSRAIAAGPRSELLVLSALVGVGLILLDRLARQTDSPRTVASIVSDVNPCTLTALGIGVAGAHFALVPIVCAAIVGGLASAWLLMTKLTD